MVLLVLSIFASIFVNFNCELSKEKHIHGECLVNKTQNWDTTNLYNLRNTENFEIFLILRHGYIFMEN